MAGSHRFESCLLYLFFRALIINITFLCFYMGTFKFLKHISKWKDSKKDFSTRSNSWMTKLESFITGDKFGGITADQQTLLKIQLPAMKTYSQVLTERIALLG